MPSPSLSATGSSASAHDTAWRGVLTGLTPLALLIVVAAVTLGATMVARQLSVSQGFLVEQQVVVPVFAIGVAVAAIVYASACVRALRRVGSWQREGAAASAAAALWALAVSALIVLLPVLLALFFPEHLAPIL